MLSLWRSVVLALAVSSVNAVVPIPKGGAPVYGNIVPNRYIVETSDLQSLKGSKRSFISPHDTLYISLKKRGIAFDVQKEYNEPGVFVAAVLDLVNPGDVQAMSEMEGIQSIKPVHVISGPKPIGLKTVSNPQDTSLPDTETTHYMTGVDKAHALGYTGKGVKIGIIDTGVDYNHPSLGGGFGPGFKIAGGYDFVGDAYLGNNTAVPDNDPHDNCNGHGTHVAGIIGANPGNVYNISGVSYDASIYAYRLFGCTGSVTDDIIIEALLRGYTDGMDILTLSLGGVSGFVESSSSVVASRIAGKGVVVTIAAGNDGATGSWYASSPGTGANVISIASIDNIVTPLQNATTSINGTAGPTIPYLAATPFNATGPLPVYATSKNTSVADDACSPLPDNTPDLSGFLVVIRRGTCNFTQKLANAAAKGAQKFFIYNNGASFSGITVAPYTAVLIQGDVGAYLVDQFSAGSGITVSFPTLPYDLPNDLTGGLVSSFSSYGPSYDMYFKPAVAAPGGNILSTYPLALGTWALDSGTSMATPFVAGSAALVIQAKGRSAAIGLGMRDLFQSTAAPVASSKTDSDPLQTLSQAGSGLIQVDSAILTKTIVSPGQFTLNDTANFKPVQEIKIKNTGSDWVTYTLKHVPAGTATTVASEHCVVGPVPLTTNYASVWFSQSQVLVAPGSTYIVFANFQAPSGVDASTYPVYSGFIEISSKAETLRVSYLGAAASLKNKAILDTSNEFFGVALPFVADVNGKAQSNTTSYTFKGDDVPSLYVRLLFGSPALQVDLVPSTYNTSSHTKRDLFWPSSQQNSFNKVPIVGTIYSSPYSPRNSDIAADVADNAWIQVTYDSTFVNGTTIPVGSYRTLVRALKVTGNPGDESDYETWLSPIIIKSD